MAHREKMFFRGHQGSTRKFWNPKYRHHILIFVFLWSVHFPCHFRMHWIFNNPITWCGCIHFFPLRHFNTIITIRKNGQWWNCCSDIVNFTFIGFVFYLPTSRWSLHPTIGEMNNGESSLKWADWAEWVIFGITIYSRWTTLTHGRSLSLPM